MKENQFLDWTLCKVSLWPITVTQGHGFPEATNWKQRLISRHCLRYFYLILFITPLERWASPVRCEFYMTGCSTTADIGSDGILVRWPISHSTAFIVRLRRRWNVYIRGGGIGTLLPMMLDRAVGWFLRFSLSLTFKPRATGRKLFLTATNCNSLTGPIVVCVCYIFNQISHIKKKYNLIVIISPRKLMIVVGLISFNLVILQKWK